MTATMTIAQTILDQLGGNKFLAMTGAKNLIDTGDGLRMTIPRNAGSGVAGMRTDSLLASGFSKTALWYMRISSAA